VRPGRRLGVDVGTVRIGVAVSDADGTTAVPAATVPRGSATATAVSAVAALAAEHAAVELVVGLPLSLSGRAGTAATAVRDFAAQLAAAVPVPVRLVDERLSTTEADRGLRAGGADGRRRRTLIDQSAAAIILQTALDSERATGRPPGVLIGKVGPDAPDPGEG
jgi:putative holliday junction resolvase